MQIDGTNRIPLVDPQLVRDGASELRALEPGADAERAADVFEQLFARIIVREMQRSLPEGFFGGGTGADVFDGWIEEHLGEALAESGALDMAGIVKVDFEEPAGAQRVNEGGRDEAR